MPKEIRKALGWALAALGMLLCAYAVVTAVASLVDLAIGRPDGMARALSFGGLVLIEVIADALYLLITSFVTTLAEPPTGWGFWVAMAMLAGCVALLVAVGAKRLLVMRRRRWVRGNVPELTALEGLNREYAGKVLSASYAHMGKTVELGSRKDFDGFDPAAEMRATVAADPAFFEGVCRDVYERQGMSDEYLRKGAGLLQSALLRQDYPDSLFPDVDTWANFVTEHFDDAGLDVARHLRWKLTWAYDSKAAHRRYEDSLTLDEEQMADLCEGARMAALA